MAKRLIFHCDDSLVAQKLVADVLRSFYPDLELKQFKSGSALLEGLETSAELPWAVFSDIMMPGLTGIDVLRWIKRHGKYHFIPVMLITAELDQAQKLEATKDGVFQYLTKPLTKEQLTVVNEKIESGHIPLEDITVLDQSFAEETIDMVAEMHKLAKNLNPDTSKELYRLFHTVKGGSNSLQLPSVGAFMHTAEGFLTAVNQGNLYSLPQVGQLLGFVFTFIEKAAEKVKTQQLIDLPNAELVNGLKLIKTNVEAGFKLESAPKSTAPTQQNTETKAENTEEGGGGQNTIILSRSSTSIRIKNDALDALQLKFKKILQQRVKLNSFASQLKSEFSDEMFPNDLKKLLDELNLAASEIMEFFIALRVTSVARLKSFGTRVLAQTAEVLGKPVKFEFEQEPGLEIDQSILEVLEGGLTHVLRNSVDHGIEKAEKRLAAGKDPIGLIKMAIKRETKDIILLTIEDDGGGINKEALKAAVGRKGVMTAEHLAALKDESILDLIFVDGLSTNEQVNDISGRGVGLGAVKAAITDLGGTIKVTSEPGKGSKFIINVPRFFQL